MLPLFSYEFSVLYQEFNPQVKRKWIIQFFFLSGRLFKLAYFENTYGFHKKDKFIYVKFHYGNKFHLLIIN